MAEPAWFTADAFTSRGNPAYVYLLSYVSPSMQQMIRGGASDASEIPYVFNNLRERNGAALNPRDQKDAKMLNLH